MAKKHRRRGGNSLTLAIVVLNVFIVIIMGLLVYFVYLYISDDSETVQRTSPPAGLSGDSISEEASETTESTETTPAPLSITKAVTTPISTSTSASAEPTQSSQEAVPVRADSDYEKSFYENGLFIGDSIMTGFSGFGYLPNEIVFAKIGLNPESVLTERINGMTAAETAANMKPDRIYIMLGTNGMSYMSGDYMAKQMGKLIDSLKAASGESTIVLLTIPPVTRAHELNKPEENIDKINLYNDLLKTLADESDCVLVDINNLLRDGDGYMQEQYAEQDGLHFLAAAYKAVLSKLQSDLEKIY